MATPVDDLFAVCAATAARHRLAPAVIAVRDPVTGEIRFRATPGAFDDPALRAAILARFKGVPSDGQEPGGFDTEWP